jgi:hypothetical protein
MSSLNSEANNLVVGTGSGDEGITIYTGSSVGDHGSIFFADGTDVNAQKRGQIRYEHNNEVMSFFTNTSERMNIDVNGFVNINNPTVSGQFNVKGAGFIILGETTAGANSSAVYQSKRSANGIQFRFVQSSTVCGDITTNGSAVSYGSNSDYRLKENVEYNFDATTRLKQLKPARFNFIADADTTVDGFLAHEVQSIVPEAITGTKDATETKEKVVVNSDGNVIAENIEQVDWQNGKIADDDGNTQYPTDSTWEATKVVPVYQGIDQAKLVPLLVKTIQELEARITTLENA